MTIGVVSAAPTTQTMAVSTIRAWPWEVRKSITLSQLRQEITTLFAGGSIRLALYADDGAGYPAAIIANSDIGAIDASTTGLKGPFNFASNIVLPAGLYWLACNSSSVTIAVRAVPVAALINVLGHNPTSAAAGNQYVGWSIAATYGAMPATFPAAAGRMTNVNAPNTMFTVA
jgi:hypothetical protein